MPRTAEDVENYLLQLDRPYERDGATFLIHNEGASVALLVTPPIVAVRVDIGSIPREEARLAPFFRKLLEYNATDLMHVSYGLDVSRGSDGGHPHTPGHDGGDPQTPGPAGPDEGHHHTPVAGGSATTGAQAPQDRPPSRSLHTPERVVLSGALELSNLDINELEAALSDIDLALVRHVPILHELAGRDERRSQRPPPP